MQLTRDGLSKQDPWEQEHEHIRLDDHRYMFIFNQILYMYIILCFDVLHGTMKNRNRLIMDFSVEMYRVRRVAGIYFTEQ